MARGNILVTLLAPRLTATIESAMAALMVQFGLQEERRQTLADTAQGGGMDCLELHLSGAPDELTALRQAALELGETHGVDLVVQPARPEQSLCGHSELKNKAKRLKILCEFRTCPHQSRAPLPQNTAKLF